MSGYTHAGTQRRRFVAQREAKGVQRDISLFLLQDEPLVPGDFVMVRLGYAIQEMSEQEARSAWELYAEMLEPLEGGSVDA